MGVRYLSLKEVAAQIGVAYGTAKRYHSDGDLPEWDAMTGDVEGWKASTIDKWDAKRKRKRKYGPGQGAGEQAQDC